MSIAKSHDLSGAIAAHAAPLEECAQAVDQKSRFSSFVTSHLDRARRLAWRLADGDEAAGEDIVQDAFLKAYRGIGRFREDSTLETWFYRILVRQAYNHRRWRAVREAWSTVWNGDCPDPHPSDFGDPCLRRRITDALKKITRRQREAFVLVHFEGFTVRETAEIMGKSQGTVKSHLQRALQSLRRELADLQDLCGGPR